jgi:hypothetical protein
VCLSLPSATLGKQSLCRVPDILHSAKHLALGKVLVSDSGYKLFDAWLKSLQTFKYMA